MKLRLVLSGKFDPNNNPQCDSTGGELSGLTTVSLSWDLSSSAAGKPKALKITLNREAGTPEDMVLVKNIYPYDPRPAQLTLQDTGGDMPVVGLWDFRAQVATMRTSDGDGDPTQHATLCCSDFQFTDLLNNERLVGEKPESVPDFPKTSH